MERSLIQEVMLYDFKLWHYATEVSKNILFELFDDKARSCKHKTEDSDAVLPAIEANPASNNRGVSG